MSTGFRAVLVATAACLIAAAAGAQPIDLVKVTARADARIVTLPGELLPYEAVDLHARLQGYVATITVDRGSQVTRGQELATLVAPELAAQVAEAAARVQAAEARASEAGARLASAQANDDRLRAAAETPGAVAGLELVRAEESLKAATADVQSQRKAAEAARASLAAVTSFEGYLRIAAPFAGRITARNVHPGALVGPSTDALVRLEDTSRLRLVVAVPEASVGAVARGRRVEFHVVAAPGEVFSGTVSRIAGSLDVRTRSMPIEIDVDNKEGRLAPGMYPDVSWPIVRTTPALLVPPTAVVTTTERTFVVRVTGGRAEWVSVRRGAAVGDLIEVTGPLQAGDIVVRRASDEIREGTTIPGGSR